MCDGTWEGVEREPVCRVSSRAGRPEDKGCLLVEKGEPGVPGGWGEACGSGEPALGRLRQEGRPSGWVSVKGVQQCGLW